jgi:hypothetical protein
MSKRATFMAALLPAAAMLMPLSAAAESFDCKPVEVMELGNRVHILCAEPMNLLPSSGSVDARARGVRHIRYLAVNKTDKERANRFVYMGTAAMVSGMTFRAFITYSHSTNVNGCNPNDCRTPASFAIRK